MWLFTLALHVCTFVSRLFRVVYIFLGKTLLPSLPHLFCKHDSWTIRHKHLLKTTQMGEHFRQIYTVPNEKNVTAPNKKRVRPKCGGTPLTPVGASNASNAPTPVRLPCNGCYSVRRACVWLFQICILCVRKLH